jgi:hypothetical protein
MLRGKRILIAPSDWGLGHATRCVPVIRSLQSDNEIFLGVTPSTEGVLAEEFPELRKLRLPSYDIQYSRWFPLTVKLMLQWPHISAVMRQEQAELEKIRNEYGIDTVISDSRYGLNHKSVYNIFISHQLFLRAGFARGYIQNVNRAFLEKFDELWVPDYADDARSLSGALSHGIPFHRNVRYIGPQSRLTSRADKSCVHDYLFIISGPEPLRTKFEARCVELSAKLPGRLAMVRGTGARCGFRTGAMELFDFPTGEMLSALVSGARHIICRSGYSTLMDLHMLGKEPWVLVPTPGQPEQNYLAENWNEKFGTRWVNESRLCDLAG